MHFSTVNVQADQIEQLKWTHGMIGPELHRLVDIRWLSNAGGHKPRDLVEQSAEHTAHYPRRGLLPANQLSLAAFGPAPACQAFPKRV